MEDQNPLTYKRETLISALQERVSERERKRADAKKKADDRNKKVRDQLVGLLDEFPSFLISVVGVVENQWGHRPGTEEFGENVRRTYGPSASTDDPSDPDRHIKQLIRVYEKAEDDEVKVSVNDDVYDWL